MPQERLEPRLSVRAVVGWFPVFLFLACPAPSQPEDHLGCLAKPLLPEMLSARRSYRVEVLRRPCLYLCVFQMAWWEPLAQAKQFQREMREVFPGHRDGLAVSLFQVP